MQHQKMKRRNGTAFMDDRPTIYIKGIKVVGHLAYNSKACEEISDEIESISFTLDAKGALS